MPSTAQARRKAGLSPLSQSRLVRALGLGLAVSTLWAAAASYYLVFHDEMLARFVSRQSAMQFTYEERIGTLQRALDRAAVGARLAARADLTRICAEIREELEPQEQALETAHAVDTVLSDQDRQRQLVQFGLRRLQFFSWDKCARETSAAYEVALARR